MDNDTAILVENVDKDFLLPHEKITSIKSMFTGILKHNRTKEMLHALDGINFEVKKGEFFGIVGRNGSGKSTMLKILAGIYQPTKGKISTYGKLVPFIELGVGFNPELTGRENVYLNGAMLGFSRKETDGMYDDIVAFAELEKFMDQKLKNYSSGMQVRLAFSMATRAKADILLVDEVLAVGDIDFQRKCFDYFKTLKRDGRTVIFVSHDMEAVKEYCDRAILIEDSRLERSGDPNYIAAEYRRMFNEEKAAEDAIDQREEGVKRWGDGSIHYEKVVVEPRIVKTDEEVIVSAELLVKEAMDSPIFGFSIKNSAGEYLLGTNTKIRGVKPRAVHAGEKYTVKWRIPNIFPDGKYFVNTSAERADGITECDWLEEACRFTVRKDERTPYPAQPPISVSVELN